MGETQDEGNPPTKLRDTSIVWSHDKSKIFCLQFHKAQGPQTQQDSDQNEKTPPNMSCATLTTPSRNNYLVRSVNLFHFQLNLFPKNRQISNAFKNKTTLLKLQDMFRETIHIISQNTISKIHNIPSQHNALLQSLLKSFIKKVFIVSMETY